MRAQINAWRLAAGERLDNYNIEARLGCGGQAEVYLARDVLIGRLVALKVFRDTHAGSLDAVIEEARLMAALDDPHIVRIHHVGRTASLAYMAMEYVDGGNLSEHIGRKGRLTATKALCMLVPVVGALGAAHAASILHRDLKPKNLLITKDDRLKLSDFGLGRMLAPGELSNDATQLVGTPNYLAPELWLGRRADVRSDIYGLGACLFFMLCGHAPFPESDIESLRRAHLERPPTLPETIEPGVAELVRSLLAKDPRERPDSVQATLRMFQAALGHGTKAESTPAGHAHRGPAAGREDDASIWSFAVLRTLRDRMRNAAERQSGLIVVTDEQRPPRLGARSLAAAIDTAPERESVPKILVLDERAEDLGASLARAFETGTPPTEQPGTGREREIIAIELRRPVSEREAREICNRAGLAQRRGQTIILNCAPGDAQRLAPIVAATSDPLVVQWLKVPKLAWQPLLQHVAGTLSGLVPEWRWTPAALALTTLHCLERPDETARLSALAVELARHRTRNSRWINSWSVEQARRRLLDPDRAATAPAMPLPWPDEAGLAEHARLRQLLAHT